MTIDQERQMQDRMGILFQNCLTQVRSGPGETETESFFKPAVDMFNYA